MQCQSIGCLFVCFLFAIEQACSQKADVFIGVFINLSNLVVGRIVIADQLVIDNSFSFDRPGKIQTIQITLQDVVGITILLMFVK